MSDPIAPDVKEPSLTFVQVDKSGGFGGVTGNTVAFGALNNGANPNIGTLTVNGANGYSASFTGMTLPGSTGQTTTLVANIPVTISGNGKTQVLAKYVKDPANPPGKSLVLARADDVEILDYVSSTSRTITLTLSGTGTLPSSNWTADVDMDLKLAAGASWP